MWTIGGVRVIVQSFNRNEVINAAKLNPINQNGTIVHWFSYGDTEIDIGGLVVGSDREQALRNLARSGLPVLVSGPLYYGNILILDYSSQPDQAVKQFIDLSRPCTEPIYKVKIKAVER